MQVKTTKTYVGSCFALCTQTYQYIPPSLLFEEVVLWLLHFNLGTPTHKYLTNLQV